MWIAVIAVVLVAVGAVVAKLTWRPNPDEAHSVRKYRTALGTMEHLSGRAVQTTDQLPGPVGSPEDSAGWSGSPSVHITGRETARPVRPGPVPVPERIADENVGPGGELVFDDSRPSDRVRRSGARPVAPEFRSDRARKQAFHAMEHRQWHWRGPIVVIVVLVVFGALAFIGSRRSNNHSTTKTSITTVAGHQTTPSHQGSTVPTTTKPPHPTTTTTTKPPTQLIATSTSAGAATYSVGVSTYDIVITASGLCWVDAVDASSGSAIFSGTVQPGATQVIHATGATNVTMGASFASMTANNIPVVLPTPFQVPFTATFQPPASTASTTTTTTTTSPGTS
jgi:hypothetical protein